MITVGLFRRTKKEDGAEPEINEVQEIPSKPTEITDQDTIHAPIESKQKQSETIQIEVEKDETVQIKRKKHEDDSNLLQNEIKSKEIRLDELAEKLTSVKKEYSEAVTNLMSFKKEWNKKKAEFLSVNDDYKEVISKLNSAKKELQWSVSSKSVRTATSARIVATNVFEIELISNKVCSFGARPEAFLVSPKL